MVVDAYYHSVASRYGNAAAVNGDYGPAWSRDNPSGFRAYMTMTRYAPGQEVHRITDLYGRQRWLNDKGYRIMCAALLIIASDRQTSLTELAERIGCHRQTVSRWLTKLTAWGVLGMMTVRGRYGGLVLVARTAKDSLQWMADAARERISRIRARNLNAHPPTQGDVATSYKATYHPYYPSTYTGAHLELRAALNLDASRKQGSIRCPAHEDRLASLSWKITPQDKLLLHCFAGCTFQEIRAAVSC